MYHPNFQYTHEMVNLLMSIEKSKVIVDMLPLPANVEKELRFEAKVKMAHYSTRIEGNPLDLREAVEAIRQRKDRRGVKAEQEVRNYWEALGFLSTSRRFQVEITENFLRRLHSIIDVKMAGRKQKESMYRGPMPPGVLFAVYDTVTGRPEYIPPESHDVPELMQDFVKWLNSSKTKNLPVPIQAAIAAYQLNTIHPFEDGNGRTSRALATYILSRGGYDLKGFNSMEEYYVDDLQGYYLNLQMGMPVVYYEGRNNPRDLAPWILYFLGIMERAFHRVAHLAKYRYEEQIDPRIKGLAPKEKRLLKFMLSYPDDKTPKEIADEFGVNPRTVLNWAREWVDKGLLEPASGEVRVRSYRVGIRFKDISLDDLGYFGD